MDSDSDEEHSSRPAESQGGAAARMRSPVSARAELLARASTPIRTHSPGTTRMDPASRMRVPVVPFSPDQPASRIGPVGNPTFAGSMGISPVPAGYYRGAPTEGLPLQPSPVSVTQSTYDQPMPFDFLTRRIIFHGFKSIFQFRKIVLSNVIRRCLLSLACYKTYQRVPSHRPSLS